MRIGFTRELAFALFHALTSEEYLDEIVLSNNDIKVISNENTNTEEIYEYPKGPRWKWDDKKMQWVAYGPRKIALKTLKCDIITKRREEFFKEVEYHSICVGIKRIVHCFGVTRNPDTGNYMMVTNFANEGDLASYIKKHQQELTWERILRLSRDIAKALRELHRKGLIHCDLHSGNILNHVTCYGITWTWIADLGLCLKEEASQTRNQVYGRFEYIAPEVHRQKLYSKAADVYSFGIILWELTSCRTPFSDMTRDIALELEIIKGKRPNIVEGTPPAFAKLMQDCWHEDPNLRPNMEDVYKRIWSFSNSIIKGNRKDRYGFKAAEEDRSFRLQSMTKQINPKSTYGRILSDTPIPSTIRSIMDSCCIKDSTNNIKKESKATENQKLLFKCSDPDCYCKGKSGASRKYKSGLTSITKWISNPDANRVQSGLTIR
ncbi:kinase-like domain-containing protein [Rhizophagus diaphanus]|nr:kinase-like domain-containing protein [Rhizophagus diaphanus] [Rhizophagus sp. MUCL 43196]